MLDKRETLNFYSSMIRGRTREQTARFYIGHVPAHTMSGLCLRPAVLAPRAVSDAGPVPCDAPHAATERAMDALKTDALSETGADERHELIGQRSIVASCRQFDAGACS